MTAKMQSAGLNLDDIANLLVRHWSPVCVVHHAANAASCFKFTTPSARTQRAKQADKKRKGKCLVHGQKCSRYPQS